MELQAKVRLCLPIGKGVRPRDLQTYLQGVSEAEIEKAAEQLVKAGGVSRHEENGLVLFIRAEMVGTPAFLTGTFPEIGSVAE
jgi:hypothetical protein